LDKIEEKKDREEMERFSHLECKKDQRFFLCEKKQEHPNSYVQPGHFQTCHNNISVHNEGRFPKTFFGIFRTNVLLPYNKSITIEMLRMLFYSLLTLTKVF